MPLIGRIADLHGRLPVLVGSLVVFAVGSLVTAAAYDLPSMVTGRCLQGVGAGGLLPATLALVADLYPPRERSLPLGVVNAVQELGNVLGPLYGAVVLAFGDWRDIFWINLVVGLVLAATLLQLRPRGGIPAARLAARRSRSDQLPRSRPRDAPAVPARHVGVVGWCVRADRRRQQVELPDRHRGGRARRAHDHPSRPAPLGRHPAKRRPGVRPPARPLARRRDPGLRHGQSRGAGLLPRGSVAAGGQRASRVPGSGIATARSPTPSCHREPCGGPLRGVPWS